MAKRSRLSSERKAWRAAANGRRRGWAVPDLERVRLPWRRRLRDGTGFVTFAAAARCSQKVRRPLRLRHPISPSARVLSQPSLQISRMRTGTGLSAAECGRRRKNAHPEQAAAAGQPAEPRALRRSTACCFCAPPARRRPQNMSRTRNGMAVAKEYLQRDRYGGPAPPICKVGPRTFLRVCGGLPLTTRPWQDAPAEVGGPTFFLRARSREPAGTGIEGAAGWHEPCFPAQ